MSMKPDKNSAAYKNKLECTRRWRLANRERQRDYQREWRLKNKDKHLDQMRNYYQAHKQDWLRYGRHQRRRSKERYVMPTNVKNLLNQIKANAAMDAKRIMADRKAGNL